MGGRGRKGRAPPPAPLETVCAVCAGTIVRASTLPCGHRFCAGCVEGVVREGPPRCPLCRRRCGAWLRREGRGGAPGPEPEPEPEPRPEPVRRRICAPGEIRTEYEAELSRYRRSRRLSEERETRESERLIGTMADVDRRPDPDEDERYAREVARALNGSPEVVPTPARRGGLFKEFYEGRPRAAAAPADRVRSEDSLVQELSHFKPIHPASVADGAGKSVRCAPTRPSPSPATRPPRPFEKFDRSASLFKLRGATDRPSAFALLFVLPPPSSQSEKRKNGQGDPMPVKVLSTPKRSNKRCRKATEGSKSCSKLNNGPVDGSRCSKRLRRFSLRESSPDEEDRKRETVANPPTKMNGHRSNARLRSCNGNGHGPVANHNGNHRNLRSTALPNGHSDSAGSPAKNKQNGSLDSAHSKMVKVPKDSPLNCDGPQEMDPDVLAEQERIERMIIQEKNDYAFAKKLQRQMARNTVFTGYTVRTAAKRQSTLTEMLTTPSKKMRI